MTDHLRRHPPHRAHKRHLGAPVPNVPADAKVGNLQDVVVADENAGGIEGAYGTLVAKAACSINVNDVIVLKYHKHN